MAPVVVFGAYIGTSATTRNTDLKASRMFSSVILISLVSNPMIRLMQVMPNFAAALGCFKRCK